MYNRIDCINLSSGLDRNQPWPCLFILFCVFILQPLGAVVIGSNKKNNDLIVDDKMKPYIDFLLSFNDPCHRHARTFIPDALYIIMIPSQITATVLTLQEPPVWILLHPCRGRPLKHHVAPSFCFLVRNGYVKQNPSSSWHCD